MHRRSILLTFSVVLLVALTSPIELPAPIPPICDVTCEPGDPPGSPGYDEIQLARQLRFQNRMLPALETPIEDVIPGSRSFNYFIPIVRLPGRNGLDLDLTLYYNNRV